MKTSAIFGLFISIFLGLACFKPKQTKKLVVGTVIVIGAPEGSLLTLDERESYPLRSKSRFRIEAGIHRVTIKCDGYFPAYYDLRVLPERETDLLVDLKPYLPD